jgi:hypothetical protein
MGRFGLQRDIRFFRDISRELVDDVISTSVVLYKLIVEESKTNLYGESLNKTYYKPVQLDCIIERSDTSVQYEGFGADKNQTVEFRFNKFSLEGIGFYPEIGDIIFHNEGYFEIDDVNEDQLIGGRPEEKYSIICKTIMSRRTTIQTEDRTI